MQRARETTAGDSGRQQALSEHPSGVSGWDAVVESLYRVHFDSLCRSAKRLLDTDFAAEEVVQEAFVRFAVLDRRPQAGCELAYLRSIVMNEARSTLRRRVVARRYQHATLDIGVLDEVGEAAVRADDACSLLQHLAQLPQRQRQVLTLRHLSGLSECETATALSISRGSVKTHGSRGISALRDRFGAVA